MCYKYHHKYNPYIIKTESETNSNKKKTYIAGAKRKLVHDPYISIYKILTEARRHI